MSTPSNLTNYIITLGTTKSGSGAIFDYLSGLSDSYRYILDQEKK